MKTAVVRFPGTNRERDVVAALDRAGVGSAELVWHGDTTLPRGVDLVVLPGGFSHGDYLRAGAIAARSPIMAAVRDHAARGGLVLGICNGFQVLTEAGLLPGALIRNASVHFVCRRVTLRVETADSAFTRRLGKGATLTVPVAHNDGNYVADEGTLKRLRDEDRIALSYVGGPARGPSNPNGSVSDIAGVLSERRNVLGFMPHPENAIGGGFGTEARGAEGLSLFQALAA